MDRTLKALSILLSYPDAELKDATGAIGEVLRSDRRLDQATVSELSELLDDLSRTDIWSLRERFVDLFDRSRSCSLNLFEHVHGEDRNRGMAMINLLETYGQAGLEPSTNELPDHLPTVLEFLSLRPAAEARDLLADAAHILAALKERLSGRNSPYAAVFRALVRIAGTAPDPEALAALLDAPDPPGDDLEALDAAWTETEVAFGPGAGTDCPQARDLLARMSVPERAGDGREALSQGRS